MIDITPPLHSTLDDALYAIRAEVGPLLRDSENPHFKSNFTSLPALVEKADPIAWKHGVLIRHQLNGDVLTHQTWFNHECVEVYNVDLPNPAGTAQGLGSAITYMRRYDTVTTLGLVSELDDDGAAASVPVTQSHTVRREAPVRPVEASNAATRPTTANDEIDEDF